MKHISELHYISQATDNGSHLTAIENVLKAGCTWVQLRIKDQSTENILDQAIAARHLCDIHKAKLIVNDHPAIALEAGAYGVHLGLDDMSVSEARKLVGNNLIIGGTANTLEQVLQRVTEGVDYVGLGPYRFTTTKKKLSPILGHAGYQSILSKLRAMNVNIPIIAIGGINLEDISLLRKCGLYGVALSAALTDQQDLQSRIENIHLQLQESPDNVTLNNV